MTKEHPGVTYYEEDRGKRPFMLRIGGSNDYVSAIKPNDDTCCPPGSVNVVAGRSHSGTMKFHTMHIALVAADRVFQIEGFHVSIEPTKEQSCNTK